MNVDTEPNAQPVDAAVRQSLASCRQVNYIGSSNYVMMLLLYVGNRGSVSTTTRKLLPDVKSKIEVTCSDLKCVTCVLHIAVFHSNVHGSRVYVPAHA
jgi:hypothetical protein